jgi:membrane protein implicated in regulation of membrane protease activity
MSWWIWILVGLALLSLEMLTPGGFFVFFFGLAALVVGAVVGCGLSSTAWFQWLLFSVLSIGSVFLFRKRLLTALKAREGGTVGVETLVGEVATLLDDLAPAGVGKAELRGTAWSVRSEEPRPLPRGQRCRVQRVEGLTLWVKAE